MKQALNAIASILTEGQCNHLTLPWHLLRYQHTAALRAELMERYAPATANKFLSALKGVLSEAHSLELMGADDFLRATKLKQIRSQRLPAGRALTPGEIAALMDVCCSDLTPAGFRDAALLALLMSGLRRSEVVALAVADFNPENGAVRVLSGKGRKDRITYTPAGGVEAISDWLQVRSSVPGPLLNPINKSGAIAVDKSLTPQAIFNALAKRGEQAGVLQISPHDFRRTFISNLLDLGADIATVQRLVGHASPLTTSRYDRRGEDTKRKAVGMLFLPYRRSAAIQAS